MEGRKILKKNQTLNPLVKKEDTVQYITILLKILCKKIN